MFLTYNVKESSTFANETVILTKHKVWVRCAILRMQMKKDSKVRVLLIWIIIHLWKLTVSNKTLFEETERLIVTREVVGISEPRCLTNLTRYLN